LELGVTKAKPNKKPEAKKKAAKKKAKPLATVVTYVLDESGSMASIKHETLIGFNKFIEGQKELPGEMRFTLVKFDSVEPQNVLYNNQAIKEVQPLTEETYRPRGSTPLIDAACFAILRTDKVVAGNKDECNVIVAIETDGQENCSSKFTFVQLNEMIANRTKAGWKFVFMGTGIDAYATGVRMGIDIGTISAVDPNKPEAVLAKYGNFSSNLASARSSGVSGQSLGASMDYSDAQTASQGDIYAANYRKKPNK
jgi:hypothetical protein